jgi:hypothetical protein
MFNLIFMICTFILSLMSLFIVKVYNSKFTEQILIIILLRIPAIICLIYSGIYLLKHFNLI